MGTSNAQTENEKNDANGEAYPGGTSIEAFFAASVILVTGATGFLGKALVEKLLRSCPRINTIYVLIRKKKNYSLEERLKILLDSSVFDRIRWECPAALNKVVPIMGDVSEANLGLSEPDRLLLTQKVNIVFHSAASVRFDEPLKIAIILNTRGTQRIIELCSEMINLISFVHVSTAYSNAGQKEISEKVYDTNIKPDIAMDMSENLDDEMLEMMEKKICGNHPNTYTLTKSLAEMWIYKRSAAFPVSIIRPGIIGAAYKEPFPGWIDNITGITGIMMELGRGSIRSLVVDKSCLVDLVPVDYVVDTIICAAWNNVMRRNNSLQIYNCVSSTFNPVKWGHLGSLINKYAVESPSKYAVWYPGFFFTTNALLYKFSVVFLHYVPAFIIDIILKLQGSKAIMLKTSKKFERMAQNGKFFSTHDWTFSSDNLQKLIKTVQSATDAKNYNINIANINWDAYVHKYLLGIRQYLLKDDPDSLTRARSRILKFYWIHKFIQMFMMFTLYKIIIH